MIRVRLINEGKVVKQITSRLHESVVLAQIEKYKDPFDSVQIVDGELSEGAKDMLHRVAKKIIPAAMAAGVALGGAHSAQAGQGGANPNYPGLNYSVGDHVRDIVSPNYKERLRQRDYERETQRKEWNAQQNELRKQRIAAARASTAQPQSEQGKHYDQARMSGDGRFIVIYGVDDKVTRIPAKGTEFMPADSQRMAHYITPSGHVYYVRHPHTAGIASSVARESVSEAGTIGTVGTIPASGASSNMQQKTKFAPTGKTTDVQVNDRGELELADPDSLDPITKQKMAKAGLKVAEGEQSPEQELERLKLRQNAEHGRAPLKRQAATQARIRELEKQIKNLEAVKEGYLDNPGQEDSPVAQAIIRRILMQRTDLLAKHGPEKVGQAVDEVADFVGDVDEIGSSDVSGWVRHVEQVLGNMGGEVDEAAPMMAKAAAGFGLGALAAAGAPAIVGILGPLLGIPMAAYGAYSAAKLGMQGVEKLWDMAADKLGGDDKVAQYTSSKIAALPPEQQKAAAGVIKQLGEARAMRSGIIEAEHGLDAILDQYAENWASFKAGGDLDENPDFYEALFDYFSNNGEMPYGVQKARTGDPIEWLTMKMDNVAGNDPVAEAEDDEASAADQAAADKNIIMQIRRAADYEKPTQLQLADGARATIDARTAKAMLAQFDRLRPDGKELMQQTLNTHQGFEELSQHFGGGVRKEAITRVGKIMANAVKESRWGKV